MSVRLLACQCKQQQKRRNHVFAITWCSSPVRQSSYFSLSSMLTRCNSERMLKPLKIMLDALDLATLVLIGFLLMLTEYRPSWWWSSDSKPRIQTVKCKTVRDIPGPGPALPILGTRWIYSTIGRYKLSEVHEAYKDMFAKFGSIIKEEALWNFPVVSLLDKKDIEAVLKHPSRFPLRPPTEATAYYRKSRPDRYTTLGIVNEQGETWHKLRTVLTPELTSPKTILRFVPELNFITEDFLSLLKTMRDNKGTVTNFDDYAIRMGLESTCTLILGRRLGFLERDVDSVAARLGAAVRGVFRASRDTYYGLPFWKMFPTPAYKLLVKSEEDLYDVVSEMVEAAQKEESDTYSADGVGAFFMSLLATPGLDVREKRAAIIDFVAAGIQTLGNTLIFALYLLAKNPRAQQRLYEEVSELAPSGSPFTAESLRRATYLQACVMEAFRILPTATCVARILESEMKLSGYHLSAGTVVLCHTWLACLEESNFTAAKEFRPERWLQNQGGTFTRNSPFLVVPFGCGRRICPGKRFVEQEMHLVLAKMVREFEIGFEGDLKLQFEFLLCPSGSINFTFKDRQ